MMDGNVWKLIPLAVLLGTGCGITKDLGELDTDGDSDDAGDDDDDDDDDDATGGTDGMEGGMEGDDSGDDGGPPPENPPSTAVDILFVVDNSGSMGEEQGLLAAPLYELTEPLMQAGVSFRIAVTTTDNGNPWCTGTTPEAGSLVMSSCRERLDDFVFDGATQIDATDIGCTDVCALDSLSLSPTTTELDPTPSVRPWIEHLDPGNTNVPGFAPSQVLSCALPMGINGCGFEQPLETMQKALTRATIATDASYGFVRDAANLLVVFVTDEADCSHNEDQEIIFLPEGSRTFWSLPDEGAPTSAVCWNAGIQCSGDPLQYDECHSVSLDPQGNPTTDELAVMQPVNRYIEFLEDLHLSKSAGQVRVMGFVGRSSDAGPYVYGEGDDPGFNIDFGIGPGCIGGEPGTRAVPPVRLREVANAINPTPDGGMYSVCAGNYGPALTSMADEIISWAQ